MWSASEMGFETHFKAVEWQHLITCTRSTRGAASPAAGEYKGLVSFEKADVEIDRQPGARPGLDPVRRCAIVNLERIVGAIKNEGGTHARGMLVGKLGKDVPKRRLISRQPGRATDLKIQARDRSAGCDGFDSRASDSVLPDPLQFVFSPIDEQVGRYRAAPITRRGVDVHAEIPLIEGGCEAGRQFVLTLAYIYRQRAQVENRIGGFRLIAFFRIGNQGMVWPG